MKTKRYFRKITCYMMYEGTVGELEKGKIHRRSDIQIFPSHIFRYHFNIIFIIKYLSVSRQVHSLFQTEFSKECDLELPPSTSSIFLFP
jgi:hypothetical protein